MVIGGAGSDVIFGDTGRDVILGDNGSVVVTGGIVSSTGGGGLLPVRLVVEEVTFDGLPGSLTEIDVLLNLRAADPLLDIEIFRRIFSLGAGLARVVQIDGDLFRELLGSGAITLPAVPGHGEVPVEGAATVTTGAIATGGAAGASGAIEEIGDFVATLDASNIDPRDGPVDALFAAFLGAAGLMAVQPAPARRNLRAEAVALARAASRAWRRWHDMPAGLPRP